MYAYERRLKTVTNKFEQFINLSVLAQPQAWPAHNAPFHTVRQKEKEGRRWDKVRAEREREREKGGGGGEWERRPWNEVTKRVRQRNRSETTIKSDV